MSTNSVALEIDTYTMLYRGISREYKRWIFKAGGCYHPYASFESICEENHKILKILNFLHSAWS